MESAPDANAIRDGDQRRHAPGEGYRCHGHPAGVVTGTGLLNQWKLSDALLRRDLLERIAIRGSIRR